MTAGDPQAARQSYLELVRLYPTCPEVPYVYLAFGEYYFAAVQPLEARQFYLKAAAFSDPGIVAFATYKIAWCDLNLGDATSALAGFAKVLRSPDGNNPDASARLRRAALADCTLAYAEAGDPRKAASFFRHMAGDEGMKVALRRLARVYLDRGDDERATIVCTTAGAEVCD